jgi:hypothetical protein
MNQLRFDELCSATALVLQIEPPNGVDAARVLTVDGIDVVLTFDEEDAQDSILCYIDLGEPKHHDRTEVCERLLELNLQNTPGRYAFDIEGSRAIFCITLPDAESLDAYSVSELLRYYLEMTDEPRGMVSNPGRHDDRSSEPTPTRQLGGVLA